MRAIALAVLPMRQLTLKSCLGCGGGRGEAPARAWIAFSQNDRPGAKCHLAGALLYCAKETSLISRLFPRPTNTTTNNM
jgi:hypothetical protein